MSVSRRAVSYEPLVETEYTIGFVVPKIVLKEKKRRPQIGIAKTREETVL
jgi:hypothetical protein